MRIKLRKQKNLLQLLYLNRLRNRCRIWSYQWLINRKEKFAGTYNLLKELEVEQPVEFMNLVRMNPEQFHALANIISPQIKKKDTNWRKAISVKLRLAITLSFLATG